MRQLRKFFTFLPIAALALLYSCEFNEQTDSEITDSYVTASVIDDLAMRHAQQVQEIFYSVPSPMEMASILKRSGATYDMKLLNDVKSANTYSSVRSQALNLGIYGADLSYVTIFNQNQEAIIYMSCTKKLADNLGVSKAFNEEMLERMETNVDNRDSLLNIISETYYMLDAYLKENNRDHISAMVIAAGWIEGLYLATSIALNDEEVDNILIKRIAEQKFSLNNLLDLVNAYNKNNRLDDIYEDLKRIEKAFEGVQLESQGVTSITKEPDGSTRIGGATRTGITTTDLETIARVVQEIRANYIS